MYHLVNNFANRSGDALVGYFVKLKDADGNYATLFSDTNETPIATVSGVADAGITDANGEYDIYVADGTYDVEFFDKNDITLLVRRIPAVPMYGFQSSADLSAAVTAAEAAQAAAEASVDAVQTDLASTASGKGAAMVGFLQSGTGAVARTAQAKLSDIISVKDFGAVGDGTTDDTAAFQAAIDVGASHSNTYTSIYIPPGLYRITDTIEINKNYLRLFGEGAKSCLYFDPASTGKVMLLVQNSDPAALIGLVTLDNFGIRTLYPSAYAKTAIKLIDASGISIHNISFPDESWQGGAGIGSIGIHMCGRDTHNIYDNIIKADAPIYADLNPNNTTYQFDVHTFRGLWLQTLKSSNYAITFAPGVNPSSWTVDGGCVALQGKGGIYLNNQGVATETSSLIHISGFRAESGTASGGDAGGYGIFMDFGDGNPACGNIAIEESSVNDPTCNGYSLRRVTSLSMRNVNLGAATTALTLDLVNQAEIFSLGVNNAASVTFTDMEARVLRKLSGAAASDKSIAYGLFVRNASGAASGDLSYENDVRRWTWAGTLANGAEITLPELASGGIMRVSVVGPPGVADYTVTYSSVALGPGSDSGYGANGTGTASVTAVGSGVSKLTNHSSGTGFPFIVTTWSA